MYIIVESLLLLLFLWLQKKVEIICMALFLCRILTVYAFRNHFIYYNFLFYDFLQLASQGFVQNCRLRIFYLIERQEFRNV